MEYLGLRDTQISDIGPLSGFSSLSRLDLDGSMVSDVTPLLGLKKLRRVNLHNVKIDSSVIRKLKQALPELEIER